MVNPVFDLGSHRAHQAGKNTGSRLLKPRLSAAAALAVVFVGMMSGTASAQEPVRPGEAYVTRFSGTRMQGRRPVIDTAGIVGSIIDIRAPGRPPRGEAWLNAPQRLAVTAAEVGQVFGIAFDDGAPPSIYLAATSAFGLHRTPDNTNWMDGMWGRGAGPGTIWKLSAASNYRPEIFAQVTLDGRTNTGASLGGIAFDRWNRQLYVSDLETGMIHRFTVADGLERGRYDHGSAGRSNFIDVALGARQSLAPVSFNPNSGARIGDCGAGTFAQHVSCWNYADFRRRVWGLGVRRDSSSGEVRLYYSVWGSQGFGDPAWFTAGNDRRNTVWSVRIGAGGDFDLADVRRELALPDFFSDPAQIASVGASHPVSHIAFPKLAEQNVMLVAERGGVRNLGLDAASPFARPHESRVLRYELDQRLVWQPAGRYDVGNYDRKRDGQPYLRANAAGGVAFGFGYGTTGQVDQSRSDHFVWMTGDRLCSPDDPCEALPAGSRADIMQVHGLQGTPTARRDELATAAALQPYPVRGYATPPLTPRSSFMIDSDINVDNAGALVAAKIERNDATKIGGIEIFAAVPQQTALAELAAPSTSGAAPGAEDKGAMPGVGPAPQGKPEPSPPIPDSSSGPQAAPGGAGQWSGPGAEKPASPSGAGSWSGPQAAPGGAGQWGGPGATQPASPGGAGSWGGPGAKHDLAIEKGPLHAGLAAVAGAGALNVCAIGQPCPFTITISNVGNARFEGSFRFKDTMPSGLSYSGASAGWSCAPSAGNSVSCTSKLALEPGQSASLTLTLTPTGNAPQQPLQVENCVAIDWSATAKGGNAGTDRACSPVILAPGAPPKIGDTDPLKLSEPDIRIQKKATASCQPGDRCDFVITIEGTDPTRPFTGPFNVTDILTAKWPFAAGGDKLGLWTCKPEGGVCTYDVAKNPNLSGGLWGGQPHGIGIGFDVPADQKDGTVTNCVFVTFPPPATGEISRPAKTACVSVEIGQTPQLAISKTFDKTACRPGEECNFTVAVRNEGKGAYTGLLTVWDYSSEIPNLIVDSVSAQGWNCRVYSPQGTSFFDCTKHSLAVGETATFSVKARIAKGAQVSAIENCASVLLYGTNVGDLSYSDRVQLARSALEHNGYQTSLGGPWTDTDRKALADYKTRNPIFVDTHGNIDTSGEVTDEFLKTLLPRVGDASGKKAIAACNTVHLPPQLAIEKTGLSEKDYNTRVGQECVSNHICTFTIKVSGTSGAPYTETVVIRDVLPSGWIIKDFSPKTWQCTGSDTVHCTHPPADLIKGKSLLLKIDAVATAKFADQNAATGVRHPWIVNCAYLEFKALPVSDDQEAYRSCYRLRVSLDFSNFDFVASGTGNCTPPNCSFYQFTATLKDAPYKGPLSLRITPPPGSAFPVARVTASGRTCPTSGWSCTGGGSDSVSTCRHANCTLATGERVVARIDGRIAPGLTEPPPVEQQRTACALLEWQGRPSQGIEQLAGARMAEACFSTRILAQRQPGIAAPVTAVPVVPTVDCIGGKVWRGDRCVCPEGTVELRNRCVACTGGRVPVGNRCVCPVGTIERGDRCVACTGGKVQMGNRCLCPPGTIERASICVEVQHPTPKPMPMPMPMPMPPQQYPVQPQLLCLGGKIPVGNKCVCPANTIEVQGRCVPRRPVVPRPAPVPPAQTRPQVVPAPTLPKLQTIPGKIICPAGTKEVQGKCMPIIR